MDSLFSFLPKVRMEEETGEVQSALESNCLVVIRMMLAHRHLNGCRVYSKSLLSGKADQNITLNISEKYWTMALVVFSELYTHTQNDNHYNLEIVSKMVNIVKIVKKESHP